MADVTSVHRVRMVAARAICVCSAIFIVAEMTISATNREMNDQALVQAVIDCDTSEAFALLNEGADPNYTSGNQKPSRFKLAVARVLQLPQPEIIKHNPPIISAFIGDYRQPDWAHRIRPPIQRPNLRLLEALLRHGANANVHMNDRYSFTPLMFAAEDRQNQAMLLLLKYGANPDERNAYGETAVDSLSSLRWDLSKARDYLRAEKVKKRSL